MMSTSSIQGGIQAASAVPLVGAPSASSVPVDAPKKSGWITRADGQGQPDSLRAWSVAFGSFCAGLACMGQLYSGGIFIEPLINEFHSGLSETSLVVTLGLAMFYVVGLVATHAADHFGVRPVTFVGAITWNLGWILGSLSTQLWESIMSQAVLCGIGTALVYWPMVSILPQWFKKYRATAMGFAVLGSGLGSIIISFGGQAMIENLGWRNSLRVIGAIGAFLLVFAVALVDRRVPAKKSSRGVFHGIAISIRDLMKIHSAKLFLTSVLFFQFSFFVPYTFLPSYAVSLGLSASFSAFALAMLGIGSAVGRIIFGPIADKCGRFETYRVNMLAAAVTLACWPACTSESSILAFAFFYGAFGGGFAAMFAVVAAELWGPERLSALFTMVNLACIPGAFASGPAIGAIVQGAGYGAAIGFTAGMMFIAFFWVLIICRPKSAHQEGKASPNAAHLPMSSMPTQAPVEGLDDKHVAPQVASDLLLVDVEANAADASQRLLEDLKKYNVDVAQINFASEEDKRRYILALQYLKFREGFPEPPPEDVFTRLMNAFKEMSFEEIKQKVREKFGTIPAEWQYTQMD